MLKIERSTKGNGLKIISLFAGLFLISACGVKGDPVPPQAPPPIGRGKPSYSKATMTLPEGKKKKMPEEKDWVDEEEEREKQQQQESNENEN